MYQPRTTDISSQFITIIAIVLAFTLSDNHHLASTRPPLDFGIVQFSLSCPRFFSHLVHFKYFNVDGCHTLEFIINCEQSLGRWKVHLMTSGMKGVMLGMLTNADDLSSPSSFPYRRILPQESQFIKTPACWGFPGLYKYSMG